MREDIILHKGYRSMKEVYVEVTAVDDLIKQDYSVDKKSLKIERIRFQIDGTTAIHYFALDSAKLKLVLNVMEEEKKEYLTAVLM